MRKSVISWLLTVGMGVSMLPTSVLADTLAADQEQQTQQEQIAPVDTENTVPAGNEETQEQQEPAPETPAPQMARSGGTALALAEGTVSSAKEFAEMDASGSYTLTKDIIVTEPYASDFSGTFDGNGHTVTLDITASTAYVGLFSKLAGGAVVKNVITAGSISGKVNNVVICQGGRADCIAQAAAGEAVGTLFTAPDRPHEITAKKLWIALGDSVHGTGVVDEGARDALVMRGKSLLSVGIRAVEGDFGLDDIVDVADETGHVFARGRAAAASDLLKLACGRSREEVASNAILAVLADRPVIHRDELVLFE